MKKAPAKALFSSGHLYIRAMLQDGVVLLSVASHGWVGTGLAAFILPCLFHVGRTFQSARSGKGHLFPPGFPRSGQTGALPLPGLEAEGQCFVSPPSWRPCRWSGAGAYPAPRGHGMNSLQRTRPPQVLQIQGFFPFCFFAGSSSTMTSWSTQMSSRILASETRLLGERNPKCRTLVKPCGSTCWR